MKFERHKDPRETMEIGIPRIRVRRVEVWRDRRDVDLKEAGMNPPNPGFYIMECKDAETALRGISENGVGIDPETGMPFSKFLVQFEDGQDIKSLFPGLHTPFGTEGNCILAHNIPTCILIYSGKEFPIRENQATDAEDL